MEHSKSLQNNFIHVDTVYTIIHVYMYIIIMLIRDEKEGRKKEARS